MNSMSLFLTYFNSAGLTDCTYIRILLRNDDHFNLYLKTLNESVIIVFVNTSNCREILI